ncbi:MAG TPA: hypothetical protein VGI07_04205 [Solirubrobacteraceae bacterium]|jgi:hypothetical protein
MAAPMTPYGFPTEAYHCLLDEQPYYLVPPRLYGLDQQGPMLVNPDAWFSWQGPPPADSLRAGASLLAGGHQVWVTDHATGAAWPYWVGENFLGYLWDLAPGEPLSQALPPHVEWVLTRAEILVPPGHGRRRRQQWHAAARQSASGFHGRGYVAMPGLVPAFHLGALRRYYRYHTRVGSFPLGDDQVSRRYVAHNEAVAHFLHAQLADAVSDVAQTMLVPSYAYLAAYESGSELSPHTDREPCEYTVTLSVDATPEPRAQSPWPIKLDVAEGTLAVWQFLGDGLLFRGRYLPHHRDPLPPGHTSTSLLLHYVDEGFHGALN